MKRITDHKMHSELVIIPKTTADAINLAKKEGRRIICVGTTSVRSVESFLAGRKNAKRLQMDRPFYLSRF